MWGQIILGRCKVKVQLKGIQLTRVLHLELTLDESTHALILALRLFISRRDYVKLFISDNFQSFKSKDIKNYLR